MLLRLLKMNRSLLQKANKFRSALCRIQLLPYSFERVSVFCGIPRVAPCAWTVRFLFQGSPFRSDKRQRRTLDRAHGQALCLAMRAFASYAPPLRCL